ncbi:MAG: nucleoside phosphorylase [Leptolyngbya sp. DLM2.Bin15]|nr:MAG: nucleoside phosphorylase [Leptolyngbya sp. DLM2.Bin15]
MIQPPLKAVILTALPVEFQEVRKFVTDSKRVKHRFGNVYEQGTFTAGGQEWQVGIVETGTGDSKSALQTERAVSLFDPDVVIFVGVAGGIKDVAIGDVVASTKVYGYEFGKAEEEFKPRPEIGLSGFSLVEEAKAEARSENPAWLKRLTSVAEVAPRLRVGPIAVGEKVVASKESSVYKFLRQNYSDALAVEMEGYGFLEAVNAREKPLPAIVIRGISDLIDNKNDDVHQEPEAIRQQKASHHASALAFQLLATYSDPDFGITGGRLIPPRVEARFWDGLFACFEESDLAFLKVALEDVLIADKRDLLGSISTLAALRTFLVRQDDQNLALAWVKHLIEKVNQASEEEPDFIVTPMLQSWYDAHNPTETGLDLESEPSVFPQGYLLVTLEPVVASEPVEYGKEADNVRLMAELHVPGETPRTDYLAHDTQCSIDEVCDVLSQVIPLAGEVKAVEIFLVWQHLEQPVHDWKIRSSSHRSAGRRSRKELWKIPRSTLVRSLDRLQDKLWSEEWLKGLKERWQQLQSLKENLADYTCCAEIFTDELFEGFLNKKLIFKFLMKLPEDRDDLADLLYEVIGSKVPIWLWAYQSPSNPADLSTRLDQLLTLDNLKESALLAQAILNQRQNLQELGLLFDCHTRIPRLPTLAVDESGRLRQPAA